MEDIWLLIVLLFQFFCRIIYVLLNLYIFIHRLYSSVRIYHNLFIHCGLMGIWVVSSLGLLHIRLLGTFWYVYFGEHEYFPQVSMYQKWNGWEYIWFNFSRYLQNSVSLWLCQELRFNNRKVRQTFNEKISLRTQDFNFPETIYYIAIYYCIFSWRRIFFAYSGNTIFKILLKHSAYFT